MYRLSLWRAVHTLRKMYDFFLPPPQYFFLFLFRCRRQAHYYSIAHIYCCTYIYIHFFLFSFTITTLPIHSSANEGEMHLLFTWCLVNVCVHIVPFSYICMYVCCMLCASMYIRDMDVRGGLYVRIRVAENTLTTHTTESGKKPAKESEWESERRSEPLQCVVCSCTAAAVVSTVNIMLKCWRTFSATVSFLPGNVGLKPAFQYYARFVRMQWKQFIFRFLISGGLIIMK